MATGRERRAERLNERLRGAQRANIGSDDSFQLDIAGLSQPPAEPTEASPDARQSPTSSVKRRRLNKDGEASQRAPSAPHTTKDPFDLPDSSKESAGLSTARRSTGRKNTKNAAPKTTPPTVGVVPARRVTRSGGSSPVVNDNEDPDPNAMETLPTSSTRRSSERPSGSRPTIDEVAESPANAPGSGRRRRTGASDAPSSSTRLQAALSSEQGSEAASSPLARKQQQRRSRTTTPGQSSRLSRRATSARPSSARTDQDSQGEDAVSEVAQPPELSDQERGGTDEISDGEAAKVLGRRRTRRSMAALSPELGSGQANEGGNSDKSDNTPRQVRTRKRGRPADSPAVQKKPVLKKRQQQKPKRKTHAKPQAKTKSKQRQKAAAAGDNENEDADSNTLPIEVTVQRLVNYKAKGDDGMDPLQATIPFANNSGESAVDVFAQVCEEVASYTIAQYEELGKTTEDSARKKECRIKARAIEAYREELSSRLLQHAIHLNHWHSLRKRVRHVQKEKLALREEIMRLRGEREEVALRMDAVRIKHEAFDKDATSRLNMSSLMRGIELAVARGQEGAPLSRQDQKRAELGNLELLVAQVADEASSSSATGGLLSQVKEFNGFLERAAMALESK